MANDILDLDASVFQTILNLLNDALVPILLSIMSSVFASFFDLAQATLDGLFISNMGIMMLAAIFTVTAWLVWIRG